MRDRQRLVPRAITIASSEQYSKSKFRSPIFPARIYQTAPVPYHRRQAAALACTRIDDDVSCRHDLLVCIFCDVNSRVYRLCANLFYRANENPPAALRPAHIRVVTFGFIDNKIIKSRKVFTCEYTPLASSYPRPA